MVDTGATVHAVADVDRRRPDRFPTLLRGIDAVHASRRAVLVGAIDAAAIVVGASAARLGTAHAFVAAACTMVAFALTGVYRPRTSLETQGALWYVSAVATPMAAATLAVVGLTAGEVSPTRAITAMGVAAGLLLVIRVVTWGVLSTARRNGYGLRRTLVVGAGQSPRIVLKRLGEYPEAGLVAVGLLSPDPNDLGEGIAADVDLADLTTLVREADIGHLVLVPESGDDATVSECLQAASVLDVELSMLPPLADLFLDPGLVTQVGGLPLIALGRASSARRTTLPSKRVFDVIGATVLIAITAPVMLATALAVWLGDRGPVLFRQRRVGLDGRPFSMLKFRSMVDGAEHVIVDLRSRNVTDGLLFKVEDDPRTTPVGRVIRRLSVDELPQLFNVLGGSMSLVGPRPLAVDPEDFGPLDGRRHAVRPGITGYWQIVGGNGLSYAEMVKLDLSYIENWSLWLDVRLLVRTIPALVHRRGPW